MCILLWLLDRKVLFSMSGLLKTCIFQREGYLSSGVTLHPLLEDNFWALEYSAWHENFVCLKILTLVVFKMNACFCMLETSGHAIPFWPNKFTKQYDLWWMHVFVLGLKNGTVRAWGLTSVMQMLHAYVTKPKKYHGWQDMIKLPWLATPCQCCQTLLLEEWSAKCISTWFCWGGGGQTPRSLNLFSPGIWPCGFFSPLRTLVCILYSNIL